MPYRHNHSGEIACHQVLREDSSVYSSQWTTVPLRHAGDVTPESVLDRYLVHVRRFTLSLVRPVRSTQGIDFRLLGTGVNLLTFAPPVAIENGPARSVTLRISGGWLVQPQECEKGELSFITERRGDGVTVVVRLADYCPLLLGSERPSRGRKLVYRLTQALLHRIVTIRFLVRLYNELEGSGKRVKVVRVRGGDGEDI